MRCGVECPAILHASFFPTRARGIKCNLQNTKPSASLLPRLVHDTRAVCLALLQQRLGLPLRHVERIDITARFDAEAAPRLPRGGASHGGHIDVLAGVELERGLCAVDLEVDAGRRVVGGDEPRQGPGAGVERDGGGGGGVLVEDEAVVDVGLGGAQREGLLALELGVGGRLGRRGDAAVVDGEVRVAG